MLLSPSHAEGLFQSPPWHPWHLRHPTLPTSLEHGANLFQRLLGAHDAVYLGVLLAFVFDADVAAVAGADDDLDQPLEVEVISRGSRRSSV